MNRTLLSLGLAAALIVPAGAAYAQSDDVSVDDDDTVTCQMIDGEQTQYAHGGQKQARLGDDALYGEPGECVLDGDGPIQTQEHKQLRSADQTGTTGDGEMYGAQSQRRLTEDGRLGSPEDCPFDGEGPEDGSGQRGGRS